MSKVAIQVDNLSKSYQIGQYQSGEQQFGYRSLRDVLAGTLAAPLRRAHGLLRGEAYAAADLGETIWALKNVSFEIKPGEVVGIIGRNGAGKSTLLKILSRITEPSGGEATIYGRVGSLLEVGTGFHPELTGRENIYLNGAILGMTRATITRQFDEIVAFAEVEQFIDTPVKHYSSGMYLRLAFAVAAHLEPDILLVDEVLAVGDAQFQKKCLGKMDDVANGGRTVILVSHNMAAISGLCQRVLYLKNGQLEAAGSTQAGITRYMADVENTADDALSDRTDRHGNGHVRITNMRWLDAQTRTPLVTVLSGQEVYLEVSYAAAPTYQKPITGLIVNIGIHNHLEQFVFALNSHMAIQDFEQALPSSGRLYCYLERFPLMPGRFFCNAKLKLNGMKTDVILNALTTDVEDGDFFGTGITSHKNQPGVYVPHQWSSELP